MLGLKYDIVELYEHNPKWQQLFQEEKKKILSLLSKYIVRIEHIGSTAISELISKPIIDIMVGLNSYYENPKSIMELESIGYKNFGECGRPGRLFFIKGGPLISTHHLHLVEYGKTYWKENILIRDYLLEHKNVANEYGKFKLKLAKKYKNDRNAYRINKSVFVEKILKKANQFKNNLSF